MAYFYFGFGSLAALCLACILSRTKIIDLPVQTNRLGEIDGARGYLALAVMCHHFFMWMHILLDGGQWGDMDSNLITNFGQSGVSIFFMVTGALFYSKICESPARVDWIKLYISRFFRLTPLMAFASVWIFVIAALKSDHLGDSSVFREFLTSLKWVFVLGQPKLFGFENTGQIVANVTWSLRYEWEFYLSLPLLGIVFYNIAKRLGRKFTLSVFLLLSYGLLYFYPDFARKAATFAPLFLTGMLAAELRKSSIVKEKLTSFGAAIVGAGALAVQVFLFHGAFGLPQIILLGLFFIPVVCGNDYFGILSRRVSIYLGEISYSIYLMHGIILFVIFQMSPAPSWVIENNLGLASLFPLAAVLSVLIPTLTHKYVEIPGIRLGRSCNENRSSLWREIVAQQK